MQYSIKKGICLILAVAMTLTLSACSGAKSMSEENIIETVARVEKALMDFDRATLQNYVKSSTLKTILDLSKNHSQFSALGKVMFEKLEIEVKSVDKKNKTVTLLVKNRDMSEIAAEFTKELVKGKNLVQLMALLNNDSFLDAALSKLTAEISEATVPDNPKEVTVSIEKGKDNLVLNFDEAAEDAVSGGVLTAIKNSFSMG